ncbi:DDE-type integrase/transposase/recombinase [Bacteroides sp. 51]|uniref:integrase catalytic domain-containing protein n=1 Tax=Bacteroides sp. 51 TaxID=2302938 RepID=UPI0013D0727D|nr:DDE-type integrase/transposase/recombinase [Bacteroides sp. 51]NDV83088.1 transposase [Bacteroides sp. 51]
MNNFISNKEGFFVSYCFLEKTGISRKTIENWNIRGSKVVKNKEYSYILYYSIPEPTRKKLPTLEELKKLKLKQDREEKSQMLFERILNNMQTAYECKFPQYREIYKELGCSDIQATKYARLHAVWQYFIDTYYSEPGLISPLKEGTKAYNIVNPGRDIQERRFLEILRNAQKYGIPSVVIGKPKHGRKKEFTEMYKYWVMQLASSGKAYSQAYIHREIEEMCAELNCKVPSIRTIGNIFNEIKAIVAEGRYGKDKTLYDKMAYVSILRAENANDQHQIDAWRVPFLVKGYESVYLFYVLDACSSKIVGYQIAETENTETILDGLEDAVRKTGALPYEIVSDNHSFNQTKIAEEFKKQLDQLGCTWTVSSNPRYKSLIERSFRTFGEQYCKEHYGYIGSGIKSKGKDARTSQELFDSYTSANGWLSIDQIKAILVYCVEEFNKRTDKHGLTPNERYENSQRPNEIRLDNLDVNPDFYRLFTRDMQNMLIRKQQISIVRSGVTYEYLLNSELASVWNDKQVRVRYINLNEGIYIYNPETDEALGFVHKKRQAHGALANQTDEDTKTMSIVNSVNKAVKNKHKEAQRELAEKAYRIDERAAELVNQRLVPKNVVEEIKRSTLLSNEFRRNGGDMMTVSDIPQRSEANTAKPEDKERIKKAESPFHVTEKVTIDLNKLLSDY